MVDKLLNFDDCFCGKLNSLICVTHQTIRCENCDQCCDQAQSIRNFLSPYIKMKQEYQEFCKLYNVDSEPEITNINTILGNFRTFAGDPQNFSELIKQLEKIDSIIRAKKSQYISCDSFTLNQIIGLNKKQRIYLQHGTPMFGVNCHEFYVLFDLKNWKLFPVIMQIQFSGNPPTGETMDVPPCTITKITPYFLQPFDLLQATGWLSTNLVELAKQKAWIILPIHQLIPASYDVLSSIQQQDVLEGYFLRYQQQEGGYCMGRIQLANKQIAKASYKTESWLRSDFNPQIYKHNYSFKYAWNNTSFDDGPELKIEGTSGSFTITRKLNQTIAYLDYK